MSARATKLVLAAIAVSALSVLPACDDAAGAGRVGAAPAAPPTPAAAPTSTTPTTTVPTTIRVPAPAPAPPAPVLSRPDNGAVVVRPSPRGEGTFEVRNGNTQDAYVTLARGTRADVAVYVRAGQTARVKGVRDGSYAVYFASGSGWAAQQRRFTVGESGERFERSLDFTTSSTSSTIWKVSLNPVPGGTARTAPFDAAGIPR